MGFIPTLIPPAAVSQPHLNPSRQPCTWPYAYSEFDTIAFTKEFRMTLVYGLPFLLTLSIVARYRAFRHPACGRQPPKRVGLSAIDNGEKLTLNLFRNGSAAAPADRDAVDRTYRSDLGGRPRKEYFIGDVQEFPRNDLFDDRDTHFDGEH